MAIQASSVYGAVTIWIDVGHDIGFMRRILRGFFELAMASSSGKALIWIDISQERRRAYTSKAGASLVALVDNVISAADQELLRLTRMGFVNG
jgi:hypothetical protein